MFTHRIFRNIVLELGSTFHPEIKKSFSINVYSDDNAFKDDKIDGDDNHNRAAADINSGSDSDSDC